MASTEAERSDDLGRCPTVRPFWCAHPHCLSCNWDDFRFYADDDWDSGEPLAAHLGERPAQERRYDARFPEADYVEDRRYVAWLCDECAGDEETVRWFTDTVRRRYPRATIVRNPGRAG